MMLTSDVSVQTGMIVISFLVLFLLGSIAGYFIEVVFRRLVSVKRWVNPGFLRGPYLPIYGFGLVIMMVLSISLTSALSPYFNFYNPLGDLPGLAFSYATVNDLLIIFIIFIALQGLEFIAGVIFVNGFKVKLWDYSNMRGNYKGIVCPQFALIWFVACVIYYYALNPFIFEVFRYLFSFLFGIGSDRSINYSVIFILGIVYGVFIIDLVQSLGIFKKVTSIAKKSKTVLYLEKVKRDMDYELKNSKKKLINLVPKDKREEIEKRKIENQEKIKGLNYKIKRLILIDPDLKKDNFSSDNRPKRDEKDL